MTVKLVVLQLHVFVAFGLINSSVTLHLNVRTANHQCMPCTTVLSLDQYRYTQGSYYHTAPTTIDKLNAFILSTFFYSLGPPVDDIDDGQKAAIGVVVLIILGTVVVLGIFSKKIVKMVKKKLYGHQDNREDYVGRDGTTLPNGLPVRVELSRRSTDDGENSTQAGMFQFNYYLQRSCNVRVNLCHNQYALIRPHISCTI